MIQRSVIASASRTQTTNVIPILTSTTTVAHVFAPLTKLAVKDISGTPELVAA